MTSLNIWEMMIDKGHWKLSIELCRTWGSVVWVLAWDPLLHGEDKWRSKWYYNNVWIIVETSLSRFQSLRENIDEAFYSWLVHCHETHDKQVLFQDYVGNITRQGLPKTKQGPWAVFKTVVWDGKVYTTGQQVWYHKWYCDEENTMNEKEILWCREHCEWKSGYYPSFELMDNDYFLYIASQKKTKPRIIDVLSLLNHNYNQ